MTVSIEWEISICFQDVIFSFDKMCIFRKAKPSVQLTTRLCLKMLLFNVLYCSSVQELALDRGAIVLGAAQTQNSVTATSTIGLGFPWQLDGCGEGI